MDRPIEPTWQETLQAFGHRVAALEEPRPGWHRLVGRQSTDGVLHHLDLQYHEERTNLVQVTTQRPLPDHIRARSSFDLGSLLDVFLANACAAGPIDLPGEPEEGPGQLIVDGTVIEARRLTHGDYVATGASVGTETVAVISTASLHDQAVRLRLHAGEPQPATR
ncbi:hypothetical protein ACFC1T_36525 [Kitasatospora sp. NPDC056076]|uniref:hypothetical protein n=1 Tax=Kitasatospora sp. NPDC056076 TaxID=3345703 RepID=UPI0035E3B124